MLSNNHDVNYIFGYNIAQSYGKLKKELTKLQNENENFSLVFDTIDEISETQMKQIDAQISAMLPKPKVKKLEILIGPSGSGKTTYALKRKMNDDTIIHFSSDEMAKIRDRWAFAYSELQNEDIKFKTLIPLIRKKNTTQFMKSFLLVLCATDRPIIIDRTNMSADERATFIRIGKAFGYQIIAHELEISRSLAFQRARGRKNHPTLKPSNIKYALSDQYKRYEKANVAEGFDQIKVTVQH